MDTAPFVLGAASLPINRRVGKATAPSHNSAAMGQVASLPWCCCDREKRANSVLNDSLQEKLLDEAEQTKTTGLLGESPASIDQQDLTREMSSPRGARAASGMMPLGMESEEDESSDGRTSRDRMDEEEDDSEEGHSPHGSKAINGKKRLSAQLGTSYRPSANAWDLARESSFGIDSVLEPMASESVFSSEEAEPMPDMHRLKSDVSVRDSYASLRETMEPFLEENEDDDDGADVEEDDGGKDAAIQQAVLRRRSMPRPSSSRVFDDDNESERMSSQSSTSRGLRELAEVDGESEDFGSYGSDSSSMQSFLTRHSDVDSSGMALIETTLVGDDTTSERDAEDAKAPKSGGSQSPRQGSRKKKGKKRR